MRIISRKALRECWLRPRRSDAEQPLKAWFRDVSHADWASPAELTATSRSASVLRNGRVVFNIAGNKYRIVVRVNYPYRVIYVRFVGTHREYDAIDVQTV